MRRYLKEAIRKVLPRGHRSYRILKGPLRGAVIVSSLHDYPGAVLGTTETPLMEWLSENVLPGQTWLDVGAHYGYIAIALSRSVGKTGKVFAFEPVVATAGCLARTRALNGLEQLTIIPLALGSDPGIRGERLPSVRGMVDRTVDVAESESFFVTGLDWLWPQIASANDPIHGIKIDVQGAELFALRGMTKTLERWKPKLVIEFHEGVDRDAVLSLLKDVGYALRPLSIETRQRAASSALLDNTSYAFSPAP